MKMTPALPGRSRFTVLKLPGLVSWHGPASRVTGTSNASQWDDLSGNGYHLTQGTGANQPAITEAGRNGLRVLTFNGTTHSMSTATYPDFGDSYTIACAAMQASGGGLSQGIFEVSNGTTNTGFLLFTNGGATTWRAVDSVTTRDFSYGDRRDSAWNVYAAVVPNGNMQVYRNSVQVAAIATYVPPNANAISRLHVGVLASAGTFLLNGAVGELVICAPALSNRWLRLLQQDLARRWL